jgi:RHS repeat-associated protein
MRDAQAATRFGYVEGWLTTHDSTTDDAVIGRQRRCTRLTRDGHGRVTVADNDGRTTFYGYDPGGQLGSVADVSGERRFGYDAAGRLVTETHTEHGARRYSYAAAGQLQAIVGPGGEHHFGYDAAGRRDVERHPDHSRRFDWDPLGRLTAITTTAITTTAITTTGAGSTRTTRLHVDALGQLAAVDDTPLAWDSADPAGALLALGGTSFVGDGHPWAQIGAGGSGHLDADWQHTPCGRPVDPWGAATDGDAIGLGYRGELVVDGLTWLRHRAYDPASRTFLQPDPLPPVPGTAYAANPYHYAGNDPVNALDPLGLRPLTDADLLAQRTAVGIGARYAGGPEYVLAGGPGAFALPTGVPLPAGADPYHGLSLVNGLLTAGDATGGMYGAKLELDAHYGKLTGQYEQGLARQNLGRLGEQSRVVNPSQFYDDLDHYSALGRHGDALVADAARVERASSSPRWPPEPRSAR